MKPMPSRVSVVVFSILGLSVFSASAITFSLDAISPSAGGLGDNLYNPGPVIAVPGTFVPGFEVDAISYGRTAPPVITEFYFSVNRGSVGAPGTAVAGESLFGDQAADIFVSTGAGFNFQYRDGNGIVANPLTPGAPAPPLGLAEPAPFPGDNVDALDLSIAGPMVYWSVNPATAAGPYGGASAADIFLAPAAPGYSGFPALYAPAALLGLLAGDDIDALVYYEDGFLGASPGDVLFFSLAPGSPTLAALGGASAADILFTSPGGGPGIFVPAGALGLLPGDDLDALDIIPEPGQWLFFGAALAGFAVRRRRV